MDTPAFLRQLFPTASPELFQLFETAAENAPILQSDFRTLRDWLASAGYEQETLHAVVLLLILAQAEGSSCLELAGESLRSRLVDLVQPDQAQAWAERLVQEIPGRDFDRLIGAGPDDHRPIIEHVHQGRRLLYFQKYLRPELELARALKAKLLSPQFTAPPDVLREVLVANPLRPGGQPLELDPEQRRALELALCRELVLISGGPGTGKTSIVLTLLRCLVRSGIAASAIALAAPTGRAAQRLADAVRLGLQALPPEPNSADAPLRDMRATTLHQLLDYDPRRDQFRRHAENPVDADVVIVDEVSMVGTVLMARLFEALRPRARLVLLGDKDQLPSVDAGAVLAHLIPEEGAEGAGALGDAVVLLHTNHRSGAHIREIAAAVNRQQQEVLAGLPPLEMPEPGAAWHHLGAARGVWLLEQKSQSAPEIRSMVQHWAEHAYLASGYAQALAECLGVDTEDSPRRRESLEKLFRLLDQTRLLTLVREGPWGCVEINRFLAQYLRPRLAPARLARPGRGTLFPGAPVLITRNDHARALYNGDVGITLAAPDGELNVVFARQESFLAFPAEALPAHELGFALTVHKSQGSEYGQVLLVFPPGGGRRLLTKELVYTGITRARDLAVLCATREVLNLAIAKKCARAPGLLQFAGRDP